jgi:hypothetical protein
MPPVLYYDKVRSKLLIVMPRKQNAPDTAGVTTSVGEETPSNTCTVKKLPHVSLMRT